MQKNKFGELVHSEDDLADWIMRGHDVAVTSHVTVDQRLDLDNLRRQLPDVPALTTWQQAESDDVDVARFDAERQSRWFMPAQYQSMDIAQHILDLCQTPEQLQRVGQELLLYQERDLFDLLKYMKYLVDTMRDNQVIWGVGRGSSVSSYVLYLLGVHRIDSLFYDLDVREFLR